MVPYWIILTSSALSNIGFPGPRTQPERSVHLPDNSDFLPNLATLEGERKPEKNLGSAIAPSRGPNSKWGRLENGANGTLTSKALQLLLNGKLSKKRVTGLEPATFSLGS